MFVEFFRLYKCNNNNNNNRRKSLSQFLNLENSIISRFQQRLEE